MTDFDPGAGWRAATSEEYDDARYTLREFTDDGPRYWVRVDPLPIEPYTVIRAKWRNGDETDYPVTLAKDRIWYRAGDFRGIKPEVLLDRITGFQVLARPVDSSND